ncbi:MAG: DUF523 domain-containing protein [Magnetococcales bacterium]|nr:DUF523 domain-containing protein [Magnetococcales bacterium]NGZ27000.1 DUF523 domain-containing protein [Magnetococcales bacterium]
MQDNPQPVLLISGCLLGLPVRYDGGHKQDPFLQEQLAKFFQLRAICPEAEAGYGVPREPMHLEGEPPRLVTNESGREVGELLLTWCNKSMKELRCPPVCGAVLKARSPSCGVSPPSGLFARHLLHHFPGMPVVNSEDIQEDTSLKNFIVQALDYYHSCSSSKG